MILASSRQFDLGKQNSSGGSLKSIFSVRIDVGERYSSVTHVFWKQRDAGSMGTGSIVAGLVFLKLPFVGR